MSKKKKRKLNTTGSNGLIIKCVTIIGVLLLLAGGTFWFLKSFQVTAVEVEGNTHYGTEQIKEMVSLFPVVFTTEHSMLFRSHLSFTSSFQW